MTGPAGEEEKDPAAGRYGRDLFTPTHPLEADRIDYGAQAYDPWTRSRLRALGVGPGWRCLDVGAGTGTVARWLLDEAHVDEVVALDQDTRHLAPLAGPRLHPRTADLRDPGLDPGTFDLVHARFVLMHLPERRHLLSRLANWLAPGGWLVVSDAVEVPNALDSSSAYRRTMDAMWQALNDTIGTDIASVPSYPRFLREEGLTDVAADLYCPPLTPGAAVTAFWLETWQRLRGALETTGRVDAETVDQALAYLSSPDLAELPPGMLTAWGRRR
ncbi:class I SAM-dependent methyltransferase [Streptomyces sp. APSN-46.1]|uniref:class I SAM-dependent methyltransferase n=1 Tax=Streptomyces sp. APSN-46.1 TaxID=2929049 RepID=UPI001FB4C03A|nr:class I SAM-dependent methyltransferase [Streptomyces sp. APSN-46.1]MCJ1676373.1 class I SAM-dependent methyltransferase [Streptomyces sp. APSN-46.1]